MQIFLITIATIIFTFSFTLVFKKVSKKAHSTKLHVHHSVLGVLLLIIGLIVGNKDVTALGLGVYLGHVVEEVYFNKKSLIRAFFIFVTR
jgi:hypothetical protein